MASIWMASIFWVKGNNYMKSVWINGAVIGVLSGVSAGAWADVVPNASQLLQQQQEMRNTIQPQKSVDWESPEAVQASSEQMVQVAVKRIDIEGNHSVDASGLNALVQAVQKPSMTLAQLQQLTQSMTKHLQQQGFPYHRAYLPQQNLGDGVVVIRILEARYDQTHLDNQSHVKDHLLQSTLAPLKAGDLIEQKHLEHQLKLLNRLPGVSTRNAISAGSDMGTSRLNVQAQALPRVNGYVGVDNYGGEYTQEYRLNAGASVNNVLGWGDVLSVEGTTTGKHFNYGRIAYEVAVNGAGTRVGVSHSALAYELGKELSVLDAKGSAHQTTVWLSHPLVLNNTTEVIATASYDHRRLKDDVGQSHTYRHRQVDTGRVRVDAFHFDHVGGGGMNQFGVSANVGHVDFTNAASQQLDAITSQNQGSFKYVTANIGRLQNLGRAGTQLYVALQGQYSPDNLEADGFSAGGPYTVSGYASSALSGASGYYALMELRQNLLNRSGHHVLGKVFVDTAEVQYVANRWSGLSGDNKGRINSFGVGLEWRNDQQWQAQARIGVPFGGKPHSLDERQDVQAWLSLSKRF